MTLLRKIKYSMCLLAWTSMCHSAIGWLATNKAFTKPYQTTTPDARQDVISQIGVALCPYTDYCRRKKEVNYDTKLAPCCADCSCQESCWETGTCCPDIEVIDVRKPSQTCHESIVKKSKGSKVENDINHGIWSYYIIDHCPDTEQNLSIINKCALADIDHIDDYRWLSDNSTGTIYQNKFCAACHGLKNLTRWQLVTRCKDMLSASFSSVNSLLFSDKCDIINREPAEGTDASYKRCAIPFYTRCNQTGLWSHYDPDIVWACDMHNALFTEIVNKNTTFYKNAFCYACNQPEIINTPTMCLKLFDGIDKLSFRILIDYERFENLGNSHLTSNFPCEIDEFIDPYLRMCRRLICPFAQVPVYGKCKQLVEKTHGLSVEVHYTLSVVWSRAGYILTDNMRVGYEIIQEIKRKFEEPGLSCPFCYEELRVLNERIHSNLMQSNSASDPKEQKNFKHNNYTEQHFLFSSLLYTKDNCQLPNLMQKALNLAGSDIKITMDGTTAMILHVELLTENVQSLINGSRQARKQATDYDCSVTYKLRTKTICPKINISITDFDHLSAEKRTDIISSIFTSENRQEGYNEICVDDYLERLSNFDFGILTNSVTFDIRMDGFSFMSIIGITRVLLIKA